MALFRIFRSNSTRNHHQIDFRLLQRQSIIIFIQNSVFFAGLIFSRQYTNLESAFKVLLGYLILTFLSILIVFFVDYINKEKGDWEYIFLTLHGKFPYRYLLGILSGLVLAYVLSPLFALILIIYVILALAHDLFFQKILIWDVFILTFEYTLKAVAGVSVLVNPSLSPWLIACTFLLAMMVSLGKRRNEIATQEQAITNPIQRPPYSENLLDQMMAVVTSSTFISYTLYTISSHTQEIVGNTRLLYTIPYVLFGILRFLFLVYRKDLSQGVEFAILSDRWILWAIIAWLGTILILIG